MIAAAKLVRRSALVGALALTLLPAAVLAGHGRKGNKGNKDHHGHHKDGPGRVERMCKKLECTKEQKVAIRKAVRRMRDEAKPNREAMRELHKQGIQLFEGDTIDRAAIEAIQSKAAKHRAALEKTRLDMMIAVHGVLTPKQRKKFAKTFAHHRGGGHGPHKRGRKREHHGGKGHHGH